MRTQIIATDIHAGALTYLHRPCGATLKSPASRQGFAAGDAADAVSPGKFRPGRKGDRDEPTPLRGPIAFTRNARQSAGSLPQLQPSE